jgi:tRNA threonylcarbamoyladenosine biosynthesis protein TsaB
VVGVNTLLALAEASGCNQVIACLDARMGEIYHAAFVRTNHQWLALSATQVCKPAAAPLLSGTDWVGVGSGWATYGDILSSMYAPNLRQTLPNMLDASTPTAAPILRLAQVDFAAGLARPASEAMPIYIRNRVALTTLERAEGQRL